MCNEDERRWCDQFPEIPKRCGKTYDLDKFDSTFFGANSNNANFWDPQLRVSMEHAYEAIIDAGVDPYTLRGSNTGVLVSACYMETEEVLYASGNERPSLGSMLGRSMFPNRISYALDLKGPSCFLDAACSSSLYILNVAFNAIRSGECDAAIVCATNAILHPFVSSNFGRFEVLAKDGVSRPFDDSASGYVRAEAFGCLFIQKAKDAKRIYATVVYSKTNSDGYRPENITHPSSKSQANLFENFYQEIGINPDSVGFVEAHGTGTKVGDPVECDAIYQVFCKNRNKPLPIGSHKSNMGHGEGASGICALTKCIFAMENKLIPPNINFSKYRSGIEGFDKKRMQVVTEALPLDGTLIAVNSFGLGGSNAHCLLRANSKEKSNGGRPTDTLPRLVNWAGRTEEACHAIFDDISSRHLDAEFIGLIHQTQKYSTTGNIYRSFGVFGEGKTETAKCLNRSVQHFSGKKPTIVFVFSGMGSQWCEMGSKLLEIPLFKKSIEKCHAILVPKGVNLMEILTSSDKSICTNVINAFVGITAIQIAICNVLEEIGIHPGILVGHSLGEIGCAYADGCLSAEEAVFCSYARGLVSMEIDTIYGAMAAVGLGYEQIKPLLPDSIDVACHNSFNSSTISGPKEDIDNFIHELEIKGIFAKEVAVGNIAYHSRYISQMGPKLWEYLKQIITHPKLRSTKWLSTSVPPNKLALPENQFCSAEYQTNNLLNSVYFEQATAQLPEGAVIIEIAPHGLLQAILKRSLPSCINIPLTQRDNSESHIYFLSALGKLYQSGVDMRIDNLYPKIEFPVSRGTPRLSHLIKWNHTEDFYVLDYHSNSLKTGEKRVNVSLESQEFAYITGHAIDGKCIFPGIGYLKFVWQAFASLSYKSYIDCNVVFEGVKFLRATTVQPKLKITFVAQVTISTGYFEITEGSVAVVTGYIREISKEEEEINLISVPTDHNTFVLPAKDFYKELRLRGYNYNGLFKSILEARNDGLVGKVKWDNNWVTHIDSILQLYSLQFDKRSLLVPTEIEKLTIHPKIHFKFEHHQTIDDQNEIKYFEIRSNKHLGILQCGGIEIKGIQAMPIVRKFRTGDPILEIYKFVPYFLTPRMNLENAIRICTQHVIENATMKKVTCVEVFELNELGPLSSTIKYVFDNNPCAIATEFIILTANETTTNIPVKNEPLSLHKDNMVAIATNCSSDLKLIESIVEHNFEYVLLREINFDEGAFTPPQNYNIIRIVPVDTNNQTIILLQGTNQDISETPTIVKITSDDKQFDWLQPLKIAIKTRPTNRTTILYSQSEQASGILGLANCIRFEFPNQCIRYFFIDDETAPPFDINSKFYRDQYKLGMIGNVYRNGQWGSYGHFVLENSLSTEMQTSDHIFANIAKLGDLSSFTWIKGPINVKSPKKDLINIQYVGLNFRDIMLASGKISFEASTDELRMRCPIGIEFAGITREGKRVMGYNINGVLSSHTYIDGDTVSMLLKYPDSWSLAEAATIPVVYITVYVALLVRGNIKKGNTILIHSGTGGIGLAAIRVCLAYGLTVFTTVGLQNKKEYLLNQFPQLKPNHIGNSHDLSFEKMIKIETDGIGVDFVLNSLAGDKLAASIRCLSHKGKFFEIGMYDLINNNNIRLRDFLREITIHSIILSNNTESNRVDVAAAITLIEQDIRQGIVQPLPTTIYPAHDLQSAFQYLGSGKHIGKILIQIRDNPNDSLTVQVPVISRFFCDPESSYIVLGGLGGFGLELADWLILRGARKLVLSSRTGISKPYQQYRINIWRSHGVRITIATSTIATRSGCVEIIEEAHRLGPINAIFNLAMVLEDGPMENQTAAHFINVFQPKSYATEHFDELTRSLCPDLQHFIVFSSVATGRGNHHQTNYGMANSIMERIMEKRHADKLPGIAIQWGAIGDVGVIADMHEEGIILKISGILTQTISSCLEELDRLLFFKAPVVSCCVVADEGPYNASLGIESMLMKILGIRDLNTISMETKLSEMGMDSISAVEIKQILERDFDLFLSLQELRAITFGKLMEYEKTLNTKSAAGQNARIVEKSN